MDQAAFGRGLANNDEGDVATLAARRLAGFLRSELEWMPLRHPLAGIYRAEITVLAAAALQSLT